MRKVLQFFFTEYDRVGNQMKGLNLYFLILVPLYLYTQNIQLFRLVVFIPSYFDLYLRDGFARVVDHNQLVMITPKLTIIINVLAEIVSTLYPNGRGSETRNNWNLTNV